MSNVLPKEYQKKVWRFYRSRFLRASGLAALCTAFVLFIALIPAYLTARATYMPNALSDTSVDKEEIEQEKEEIAKAKALVEELGPKVKGIRTFEIMADALRARPAGISIQKMQFTKEGSRATIVISGTASNRTQVSAYRTALSEISRFETVTVPVGALAGTDSGQFSVTITTFDL